MARTKLTLVMLAALALAACGGKSTEPPKTPDTEPVASAETPADMPAPAPTTANDSLAPDKGAAGATESNKVSITVAAMKFTPAKKGKKIEVKADGSLTADGKPAGKVASDHVEDNNGKMLASVTDDGTVSGENIKPGIKFSGDDLVGEDGTKVSVGEDGTVTATNGATHKTDTLGKFDGGGSAKKAAAIVALVWMMPKEAAPKAAPAPAHKGGAAKPAPKPKKK